MTYFLHFFLTIPGIPCYCFNISVIAIIQLILVRLPRKASASDNYSLCILYSLHCVTSAFVVLIVSVHLGARERFSMPSKTCPPNLNLPTSDTGRWRQFRDRAIGYSTSCQIASFFLWAHLSQKNRREPIYDPIFFAKI